MNWEKKITSLGRQISGDKKGTILGTQQLFTLDRSRKIFFIVSEKENSYKTEQED